MSKIAVLMTCYNRKEKTLRCLDRLYMQSIETEVFLVDDGCTDGTSEAVSNQYPKVNIIEGDGTLFWNRGMYLAWSEAEKFDFDFFIWLNDDTYLFDGALKMLLDSSTECNNQSMIVGASCSPFDHSITTFGADQNNKPLYPNGKLQECDSFGGNFVLIPRELYKKCGKLDNYYRHSLGDIDYAKTVVKKGYKIFMAPYHTGECENDLKKPLWLDPEKTLKERFDFLHSPLSYSDPKEFFYFYKKHYNAFIGILHVLSIYFKLFINTRK